MLPLGLAWARGAPLSMQSAASRPRRLLRPALPNGRNLSVCLTRDRLSAAPPRRLQRHEQRTPHNGRGVRQRSTSIGGEFRDHGALRAPGRASRDDRGVDRPRKHVPRFGLRGPDCTGLGRDGKPRGECLLCLRACPPADLGLHGAGHVRAIAADRNQGRRPGTAHRSAPPLLPRRGPNSPSICRITHPRRLFGSRDSWGPNTGRHFGRSPA